ncbi:hypothetical protein ACVWYN_002256 [Pedobacter sp. UYP24]
MIYAPSKHNLLARGFLFIVFIFFAQSCGKTDKLLPNEKKPSEIETPTLEPGVVSPMSGKTGDIIKIAGNFMSSKVDDITVMMGNVKAKVVSFSNTQIEAELPKGILAYHGDKIPLTVSDKTKSVIVTNDFIIKANVRDFTPKKGPLNTEITFIGDNINETSFIALYGVRIGDKNAMSFGNNPFRWPVPMDVSTAVAAVSIGFTDNTTQKIGDFIITPPIITAINTQIINGNRFMVLEGSDIPTLSSIDRRFPYAKLGNVEIPIIVNWDGIKFTLPADMESGEWDFILFAGPFGVKSFQKVLIPSHEITNISPSTIKPGEGINVFAGFLAYTSYEFYLNGEPMGQNPRNSKDGVVFFGTPSNISPGIYSLSYRIGDKFYLSPVKLTIIK